MYSFLNEKYFEYDLKKKDITLLYENNGNSDNAHYSIITLKNSRKKYIESEVDKDYRF